MTLFKLQYSLILSIALAFFFSCKSFTQTAKKELSQQIPFPQQEQNTEIKKIAKRVSKWQEGSTSVSFWFHDNYSFEYQTFFESNKKAFGLKISEMRFEELKERNGKSYYNYTQYYKELRVRGGRYSVLIEANKPIYASGRIIENLSLKTKAQLTERQALDLAKTYIGSAQFCWESDKDIYECSKRGELIIRQSKNGEYTLHYEFKIKANSGSGWRRYLVHLDANTGELRMLNDGVAD